MKILHIIPAYKPAYVYGGPTESVSRLCEGLAAGGDEVDVYTTTANGDKELDVIPGKVMKVDGVNVTYFKRITGDHTHISPALWWQLFKTAKNYDVIHIHSWWNILIIVAARIALTAKAKVIVAPRGMLSDYVFATGSSKNKKLIHNTFGRGTLKRCVLHATARAEYEECRRLIPGWEGFVLPNILTLPDASVKNFDNECFTLIFMSRIHHKKGIEKLFAAISTLKFNLKLVIAGDGDENYIAELKSLAEVLDIESKITWKGWVSRQDKFDELNKADLFVLTSLNENFANVVVESVYMGTAVLISENVGLADFVQEQGMGWISTLETEDIAEKIKQAYNDTEKRSDIRRRGRQVIETTFSENVLIKKYREAYINTPA